MKAGWTVPVACAAAVVAGCDPCAGTPSCKSSPEVSYGAQFIDHASGREVSGVVVEFVRDSGPPLAAPAIRSVSDDRGFFQLRAFAHGDGVVHGKLFVTPPEPYEPFVFQDFTMRTSRVRGDGLYAGRVVVNPYLFIVGEVRDRLTGAPVRDARVTLSQLSGVDVSGPPLQFVTDGDGRFFTQLDAGDVGPISLEAVITAPGYPRSYRINVHQRTQFVDRPARDVTVLRLRPAFQYVGEVTRRGSREVLPGVTVEFRRTGGIPVSPEVVSPAVNALGLFAITPEPLVDVENGEMTGDLTITPPAPLPVEVIRGLRLIATDGDSGRLLGRFGYGAQVYVRAPLQYRANGAPLRKGILAKLWHAGGLPFTMSEGDSGIRDTDTTGSVPFIAPTADSGAVVFGMEVRFPGFAPETIQVQARARYDSAANIPSPSKVGPWYPWYGELRDADTDEAVAGATVVFRAIDADARNGFMLARTDTAGQFRFAGIPSLARPIRGLLLFQFDSLYAPSSPGAITLSPTQDDTLRLLDVFRVTRLQP